MAEVPIPKQAVSSRGMINITTPGNFDIEKMVASSSFFNDVVVRSFNFTSGVTLHGKVKVIKILKLRAISISTCNISYFLDTQNVQSKCKSKLKL